MRAYLDGAGGAVADEPATARALSDLLVRGLDCGALPAEEVDALVGVPADELLALARPRRG